MSPRSIAFFALLLAASSARALEPTPTPQARWVSLAANLEVTFANASGTVFKGLTDGSGRFETTPLEPGVYAIQLRIPKTIIAPARYTLALSGARPLGDALVGPGVALGMNAEVRRAGPVRGYVAGRRVAVAPSLAPATATPQRGALNSAPIVASAPSSSMRPAPAVSPARSAIAPPRFLPRPANSQPRLVNGRRYVWVASGPDSNLGYWALEKTGVPPTPGVRTSVPSSPTPSPTPRRR